MAKIWADSHISAVSSGLGIECRLSGDVKRRLCEILAEELATKTKEMETTLNTREPERKTLDDPLRTRLGFNRTKGLMMEEIEVLDSIGASAVIGMTDYLETFLLNLLLKASDEAGKDRVSTIKMRHLEQALATKQSTEDSENATQAPIQQRPNEEESLEIEGEFGGLVTAESLTRFARTLSGGMRIDAAALEELLLLWADHADELQYKFERAAKSAGKEEAFANLSATDPVMLTGWLRRMLREASQKARNRGSRCIGIEDIVELDL